MKVAARVLLSRSATVAVPLMMDVIVLYVDSFVALKGTWFLFSGFRGLSVVSDPHA